MTRTGPFGLEHVHIGSWVTVRVDPARNAVGERLRIESPVAATGDRFSKTIACPGRLQGGLGLDEVVFSFGRRAASAGDRVNFPFYDLEVTYEIRVTRLPEAASWLVGQQEARGAAAVLQLVCGGGAFPDCDPTSGPITEFLGTHPLVPGRDCKADGCPDFIPFIWDGTGLFDLTFASPLGLDVSLRVASWLLNSSPTTDRDADRLGSGESADLRASKAM